MTSFLILQLDNYGEPNNSTSSRNTLTVKSPFSLSLGSNIEDETDSDPPITSRPKYLCAGDVDGSRDVSLPRTGTKLGEDSDRSLNIKNSCPECKSKTGVGMFNPLVLTDKCRMKRLKVSSVGFLRPRSVAHMYLYFYPCHLRLLMISLLCPSLLPFPTFCWITQDTSDKPTVLVNTYKYYNS